MVTVKELLDHKGKDVWSIRPGATVYEALQFMAEKNVGALMVLDGERPVGIFTERDYARKIILKGKFSRDTLVEDVMVKDLHYISRTDTIRHCMQTMTKMHFRHLPVIEHGRLLGLISIGDVVNQIISGQKDTIEELEDYITKQVG